MIQAGRYFSIVMAAEWAAAMLAIGISGTPAIIFVGVNFAFLAAAFIVADHEARGKGK